MLTAQLIQFERTSYPGAGRAGANPQADLSLPTPGGSFFRIDNCLCLQIGVCRTVGGGVHRSEASPLGDAPNLPFSDICGPSRTPAPTGFSYCLVPIAYCLVSAWCLNPPLWKPFCNRGSRRRTKNPAFRGFCGKVTNFSGDPRFFDVFFGGQSGPAVENPVENVENSRFFPNYAEVILGSYVTRNLPLVVARREMSNCNFSVKMPKPGIFFRRFFRNRSGIFQLGVIL